jgi:hypothetical protein
MRKHLSGWASLTAGILKKEKIRLSAIIDELEALAEVRLLSSDEIELKSQSNAQITALLREEELKWYQRSKAQFILEGDSNTRYFHGIANGRHKKKRIQSLVQDEGRIEGHDQLKSSAGGEFFLSGRIPNGRYTPGVHRGKWFANRSIFGRRG